MVENGYCVVYFTHNERIDSSIGQIGLLIPLDDLFVIHLISSIDGITYAYIELILAPFFACDCKTNIVV